MRICLGDRGERGAIAIMTAFLAVVLMAVAALGVDITSQVNERQKLHDTIDAAAHAGAYDFPNSPLNAEADARANALKNDPTLSLPTTPNAVVFFCVVGSKSSGTAVETTQIPSTCNPASKRLGGTAPAYLTATYTGSKCNAAICSIPCNPTAGDVCNTVSVSATKTVPFAFAPVIGINSGSTGSVSSAACKGPCGTIPINPMDVAVVADRTGSMSGPDIGDMITGIEGMFQVMTPSQQYVALGTIGRSYSSAPSNCLSSPAGSTPTVGPWMPVAFSNLYLKADKTLNTNSQLVQAVDCLTNSSNTGTSLASPMKKAARYLLGAPSYDANNLGSLPARTGIPRKVLIFETDGQPRETAATGGDTLLTSGDVFSNTEEINPLGPPTKYYLNGGQMACKNMMDVAANAKAAGILVITIAYNLGGVDCDSNDNQNNVSTSTTCLTRAHPCLYSKFAPPTLVTDALASAASPSDAGAASVAQNTCNTPAEQAAENGDKDYFFCAASGTVMGPIFLTALGQLAKGIRLIQMP